MTQGSGNPGASNVARVLGSKWGALVFGLDALKGAIPAIVGIALDTRPGAYVLVSAAVLVFIYFPLVVVVVNSFNASRVFSWPPTSFTPHSSA